MDDGYGGGDPQAFQRLCNFRVCYRPWSNYEALIKSSESNVLDKALFASDFPITTPAEAMAGLRGVIDILEGTALPRVPLDKLEEMIQRDSLALLGLN